MDRLTLVEHVQVVFHSAASLDFEARLRSAIDINLLGTRRVAILSQEMRNLKVIIVLLLLELIFIKSFHECILKYQTCKKTTLMGY